MGRGSAVIAVFVSAFAVAGGAVAKDKGAPPPGQLKHDGAASSAERGPKPDHGPPADNGRGRPDSPGNSGSAPGHNKPPKSDKPPKSPGHGRPSHAGGSKGGSGGPPSTPPGHDRRASTPAGSPPPAGTPAAGSPAAAPSAAPGKPVARERIRHESARLAKSIADLVPLDQLVPGGVATSGAAGALGTNGSGTGVRPGGGSDPATARRSGGDDSGGDDDDDGTPGPLPFTGLALITLALTGLGFVLVGGRLRRSTRRAPAVPEPVAATATSASTALAVRPPTALAMRPSAPARPSRVLPVLAVVGLLGLAVLAARR